MPGQHPLLWLYETGTKTGKWELDKDFSLGCNLIGLLVISGFETGLSSKDCSRSQP